MKPEGRLARQHVAELWLADAYVAPGDPQARPRKVLAAYLPEKDEEFRELVYGFGFRWCVRRWQREITPRMGDPAERLAEMAHALLEEGFMVRVADRTASDMVLSGEFEDERTRWVDIETAGGLLLGGGKTVHAGDQLAKERRGALELRTFDFRVGLTGLTGHAGSPMARHQDYTMRECTASTGGWLSDGDASHRPPTGSSA
jgi:hypothetical protein